MLHGDVQKYNKMPNLFQWGSEVWSHVGLICALPTGEIWSIANVHNPLTCKGCCDLAIVDYRFLLNCRSFSIHCVCIIKLAHIYGAVSSHLLNNWHPARHVLLVEIQWTHVNHLWWFGCRMLYFSPAACGVQSCSTTGGVSRSLHKGRNPW